MSTVGIKQQLTRDEDLVEYAYQDSLGYWTIGVGHLIDKRRGGKLPPHIIDRLLEWDITEKSAALYTAFPWTADLDEPRKATLINMAFQLGVEGLAKFVRAMGFMRAGAWNAAADAFADSLVAREQTPERWARHCAQIRTGVWQ
jgi:lysozyme